MFWSRFRYTYIHLKLLKLCKSLGSMGKKRKRKKTRYSQTHSCLNKSFLNFQSDTSVHISYYYFVPLLQLIPQKVFSFFYFMEGTVICLQTKARTNTSSLKKLLFMLPHLHLMCVCVCKRESVCVYLRGKKVRVYEIMCVWHSCSPPSLPPSACPSSFQQHMLTSHISLIVHTAAL